MDKLMATLKKMALAIATLRQDVDELQRREIPAGVWKAWVPSVYTGWSSLPSGGYYYLCIGNLVVIRIAMTAGTSNTNAARISLPFTAASINATTGTNGYATDNGTGLTTASRWDIPASSTTINFYKDMVAGTWTTSGTKRIYCVAMYERA